MVNPSARVTRKPAFSAYAKLRPGHKCLPPPNGKYAAGALIKTGVAGVLIHRAGSNSFGSAGPQTSGRRCEIDVGMCTVDPARRKVPSGSVVSCTACLNPVVVLQRRSTSRWMAARYGHRASSVSRDARTLACLSGVVLPALFAAVSCASSTGTTSTTPWTSVLSLSTTPGRANTLTMIQKISGTLLLVLAKIIVSSMRPISESLKPRLRKTRCRRRVMSAVCLAKSLSTLC